MKAFLTLLVVTLTALASIPASADDTCGQLVKVDIRDGETQSYSYGTPDQAPIAALVLLAGGGGALDLDENGCARNLKGNTLTRNVATIREAGFVTALTDAPSDYQSGDGLGAFRGTSSHGDDLGDVIADVRGRTAAPVYVVGSSRGTISAVNAAAYLSGISAPEGVILFSPITSGRENAYKAWVAQTVFDEPLEDIHQPILVVAHESDACARTPADKAPDILARTNGVAEEMVIVTGGPATNTGVKGVKACQGKYPHGFGGQDKLVVELITDFVGKAAQR